jgi:hypothetical protein
MNVSRGFGVMRRFCGLAGVQEEMEHERLQSGIAGAVPWRSWWQQRRCGWPMLSLEADHWIHTRDWIMDQPPGVAAREGIETNWGWRVGIASHLDARILPWRPRCIGFVVNMLFYAVILWLLLGGPFILRRHIRLKRGRCPKCGYDLRAELEGGCPECGWNRQPEATA